MQVQLYPHKSVPPTRDCPGYAMSDMRNEPTQTPHRSLYDSSPFSVLPRTGVATVRLRAHVCDSRHELPANAPDTSVSQRHAADT